MISANGKAFRQQNISRYVLQFAHSLIIILFKSNKILTIENSKFKSNFN